MKTHKRKKSTREKGSKTVFWGARKKHKKTGHKGGQGMSGSGKRADQKKTLVLKLYGHGYFGKQGITSKGTERDKRNRINVGEINSNIKKLLQKGIAEKKENGYKVNLEAYKILGDGEVHDQLFITAKEASASAIKKIKSNGGEIHLATKREDNVG